MRLESWRKWEKIKVRVSLNSTSAGLLHLLPWQSFSLTSTVHPPTSCYQFPGIIGTGKFICLSHFAGSLKYLGLLGEKKVQYLKYWLWKSVPATLMLGLLKHLEIKAENAIPVTYSWINLKIVTEWSKSEKQILYLFTVLHVCGV